MSRLSIKCEGASVSKFSIDQLLGEMARQQASDLLITAGTMPQYRVNGVLVPFGTTPLKGDDTRALAESLLSKPDREKFEADRSIDIAHGIEGVSRFRVNVFYQRNSVAMAIRMIPYEIPAFETLGLPLIVRDFASRPHGLVLITGPAGSGKSTTMASMIDFINDTRHVHVVCIEDPIEYLHQHRQSVIAQRELRADAHTFSGALRSVFRQSPDVIMVGEMRDLETMQLALTLAETGHLILATLHTQDTTHAINRIVDVFPPDQQQQVYVQLSMVLVGIISQQLLMTSDKTRRVLACEVMSVNNAIRNQIREMQIQQIYSVIETGASEGMMTMNDSLSRLFHEGLITEEKALRRSPRPKELVRLLTAKPRRK
ncbi:MAG: PilT/PilU family type 4a pilus ATPase [Kiritimatiellae bacterium]|nr:PilT/PilU family type 4a pilus ATPase [Kiritimatiellia bacterium]